MCATVLDSTRFDPPVVESGGDAGIQRKSRTRLRESQQVALQVPLARGCNDRREKYTDEGDACTEGAARKRQSAARNPDTLDREELAIGRETPEPREHSHEHRQGQRARQRGDELERRQTADLIGCDTATNDQVGIPVEVAQQDDQAEAREREEGRQHHLADEVTSDDRARSVPGRGLEDGIGPQKM